MPRWAVQWRANRWITSGSGISAGLVILVNELARQRLLTRPACPDSTPGRSPK
jgi:hypothetical protein